MLSTIWGSASRLVRPDVAEVVLTREVHVAVALQYARPILEYLERERGASSFRSIGVEAVGKAGSARTTSMTLKRLRQMGWVDKATGGWRVSDAGIEALHYAINGDQLGPSELRDDELARRDPKTGKLPKISLPRRDPRRRQSCSKPGDPFRDPLRRFILVETD